MSPALCLSLSLALPKIQWKRIKRSFHIDASCCSAFNFFFTLVFIERLTISAFCIVIDIQNTMRSEWTIFGRESVWNRCVHSSSSGDNENDIYRSLKTGNKCERARINNTRNSLFKRKTERRRGARAKRSIN